MSSHPPHCHSPLFLTPGPLPSLPHHPPLLLYQTGQGQVWVLGEQVGLHEVHLSVLGGVDGSTGTTPGMSEATASDFVVTLVPQLGLEQIREATVISKVKMGLVGSEHVKSGLNETGEVMGSD